MKEIIFYLGLGTLSTHELDAVKNHEWRVLPLTSWLPEELGYLFFLFFHIPLFAFLIAMVASRNDKVRIRTRTGISGFLVLHGLLHLLFQGDAKYEFTTLSSNLLIFAASLLGLIHLTLEYLDKNRTIT